MEVALHWADSTRESAMNVDIYLSVDPQSRNTPELFTRI